MSRTRLRRLEQRQAGLSRELEDAGGQVRSREGVQSVIVRNHETRLQSLEAAPGPTAPSDKRMNDYLFTGAVMLCANRALATLPEGWFVANGANGTVNLSAVVLPLGVTYVQQVGPYPS